VDELVLSQEDQTQTHLAERQISSNTSLTQTSVIGIIHDGVGQTELGFFRLPRRLFAIIFLVFLSFVFTR